jgi:RNA recognition motif-containing protein
MDTVEAATSAIEQLNDFEFLGRNIVVNEAKPKEERPRRNDRNDRNFSNDRSRNRY